MIIPWHSSNFVSIAVAFLRDLRNTRIAFDFLHKTYHTRNFVEELHIGEILGISYEILCTDCLQLLFLGFIATKSFVFERFSEYLIYTSPVSGISGISIKKMLSPEFLQSNHGIFEFLYKSCSWKFLLAMLDPSNLSEFLRFPSRVIFGISNNNSFSPNSVVLHKLQLPIAIINLPNNSEPLTNTFLWIYSHNTCNKVLKIVQSRKQHYEYLTFIPFNDLIYSNSCAMHSDDIEVQLHLLDSNISQVPFDLSMNCSASSRVIVSYFSDISFLSLLGEQRSRYSRLTLTRIFLFTPCTTRVKYLVITSIIKCLGIMGLPRARIKCRDVTGINLLLIGRVKREITMKSLVPLHWRLQFLVSSLWIVFLRLDFRARATKGERAREIISR